MNISFAWAIRSRQWLQQILRQWLRPGGVPVIYQMSASDCGAACLAMLLRFWGCPVTLALCRSRVGGGQQGSTALMIAQAAQTLGCQTHAYRLEAAQTTAWAQIPTPAILHWHGDHFVVLEHWSPHQIRVIDPALGRRRLSSSAFAEGFSGIALVLTPPAIWPNLPASAQASTGLVNTGSLHWLVRTPDLARLAVQIFVASLLLQASGLLLPLATSVIVDRIVPTGVAAPMTTFGLGILLLALSQLVLHYLRTLLVITLQMRLDAHLMLNFFRQLLALPYRFFQERTSGDLLMRLESNRTLRDMLTTGLLMALLDGLLALSYLVVLLVWMPRFGLVVVGAAALQWLTLAATQRSIHEQSQHLLLLQADEESFLVETLQTMEQIKATGVESLLFAQYSTRFWRTLGMSLRQTATLATVNLVLHALQWLTPVVLLWLGVYAILAGVISTGELLAYVLLASSCLAALAGLAAGIQQWQPLRAQLERLIEVMQAVPEQMVAARADEGERAAETSATPSPLSITSTSAQPSVLNSPSLSSPRLRLPSMVGAIELRNVTFRYAPHLPAILDNLSLTIAPGETLAVVGRSGAGKSTLLRLVLGLYLPTEGELLYAGRPLREFDLSQYRGQFGVVLQSPHLINGTIADNIAYHHTPLTPDAIIRAAQLAAIHDEISCWPMGYQTRVAEGGSGLSGGQRQRLALARALVHEPPILIFDEATSHLDPITAQLIEANLAKLACTRIMMAHNLATEHTPDRIIVLEAGRITVQSGPTEAPDQGDP